MTLFDSDVDDVSFDLEDDYSSANASPSDLLSALQAFLGRNQVGTIGHYRIKLEGTSQKHLNLSIIGRVQRPDPQAAQHAQASPVTVCPSALDLPSDTLSTSATLDWLDVPPAPSAAAIESLLSSDGRYAGSSPTAVRSPRWQIDETGTFDFTEDIQPLQGDWTTQWDSDFSSLQSETWNDLSWPPTSTGVHSLAVNTADDDLSLSSFAGSGSGDMFWTDWNAPAIATSGPSSAEHEKTITIAAMPSANIRGSRVTSGSPKMAESLVGRLSQNVLRDDLYSLLEAELPRWTRWGLHQQSISGSQGQDPSTAEVPDRSSSATSYRKLESAYCVVCFLQSRMDDDLVRSRIALIRLYLEYVEVEQRQRHKAARFRGMSSVGRGNASQVIDNILPNIHQDWDSLDRRRQNELRAKFHERKKYGKRWWQLACGLGSGILIACSTRLANAVRSSAATANVLEAVVQHVSVSNPQTKRVISVLDPLAECLMNDEGFDRIRGDELLAKLRSCRSNDVPM